MPGSSDHLRAYIIIDNCFPVMLTECFCERFASRCPSNRVAAEAEQWIASIFGIVKKFSLDGQLHSSAGVIEEFNPFAGQLANRPGIQRSDLLHLQVHTRSQLHPMPVQPNQVRTLRTLPAAPKQLVGPSGLSDNDLSLVNIGLELTVSGSPVYILSNDQSLLDFSSWIRTQKQHIQPPIVPSLLQSWRCLTYLEQIHRSCNITTELMQDLIEWSLSDHYMRTELAGTQKGKSIYSQLLQVNRSFSQSVVIKLQTKATAQ